MVTMPGSQALACRFKSLLGPKKSGLAWSLYKHAGLWRAVYGLSATKRPLGTIHEEKGICSRLWVCISSGKRILFL